VQRAGTKVNDIPPFCGLISSTLALVRAARDPPNHREKMREGAFSRGGLTIEGGSQRRDLFKDKFARARGGATARKNGLRPTAEGNKSQPAHFCVEERKEKPQGGGGGRGDH